MDNWIDRYWLYPEQRWRLALKKKPGNGTHPMIRRKGIPAAVGFVPHRGQQGTRGLPPLMRWLTVGPTRRGVLRHRWAPRAFELRKRGAKGA